MIDPSASKRSSWKHRLSERWAAAHKELQAVPLCLSALGLHQPVSLLSRLSLPGLIHPWVLESHKRFKWQYLSHPLPCCLSDSSRCLCMLFPLPGPLGMQPSRGTCDTTGNRVLFLPQCQGYHRNCSAARSPLWLDSPEGLSSATGGSEPEYSHRRVASSASCTLTRH